MLHLGIKKWSTLVQIMAWHFNDTPMPDQMPNTYHISIKWNLSELEIEYNTFLWRKYIWNCFLQNFCQFVQASICQIHYGDVIMGAIASQITSLTVVYSTVYSDADQRKYQSSASLVFEWGIHRGTSEFPVQMASNEENVSIWWHHHELVQKESYFITDTTGAVSAVHQHCDMCRWCHI